MTSVLEAALIGGGGSVVGGLVGGWFALLAVRNQWRRDRAEARADRSRQAALSIADAIPAMEVALVAWAAGQSKLVELRGAFNAFSGTAAVQSIALTDSALRQRVRRHVELLVRVAALAESSPAVAAALIPTARRHADVVIESLDAHYNDAALPSYRPLPMDDAEGLIRWAPKAGAECGQDDAGGSGG